MLKAVRFLGWMSVIGFGASTAGFAGNTEVTGTITFERHSTVSIEPVCPDPLVCPRPDPFWTAVLRGDQGRFELETPYAVGSPNEPMSIILDGTEVFPGDRISAEAVMTSRDHDTQFLGRLDSVVVLERGQIDNPRRPGTVYGWSCQSLSTSPINLHASVFAVSDSEYQLRVVAVQGEEASPVFYPLLRLQGVHSESRQDQLIYQGESGTAKAQLSIREIPGQLHLPATLKLARNPVPADDPLGALSETAMACAPTRSLE